MSPTSVAALLLVGGGGFFGAIARHLINVAVARRLGTTWPWATFAINISGCFAIAFFLTLTTERFVVHERWRLLFPVGFVGAYTTFSTYEWEAFRLVEEGAWPRALSYLLASTLAGFGAVWLASKIARHL
jgi:fluoride exporter